MLIDAIKAIRWAWILIKYGIPRPSSISTSIGSSSSSVNTQRIPNVKSLWEDFSWDIAMRMRASETFQVITEDLMTDITRVTDTMHQQRWSPPGQGHRYRSSTWTTPSTTWRPWQPSPPQWQVQQPTTWSTPTPTTWQPTPTPTFPPSTPAPTVPFNPAPPVTLRNTWNSKGDKGSKGACKKGKQHKGGKK